MQITALETSTHIYKLIWINICEAEQWGGETEEKKERLRRQTSFIVSIRAPIPTPDDTTKKKKKEKE